MIALRPKINVDKRGKISTGIKAISERTGSEYPKATDYFVITDFPELVKSYGEKPKKLVVFFPDNEIESFFSADFVLYGGNQTLIRKCNGEECLHRIDETIADKKYIAGEISGCVCVDLPEDDKKRCKVAAYIKAYIADAKTGKIDNPLCYLFYTGSRNTAENIYSELKKIRNLLNGNIVGIPFGLSVEMVAGKTDAKQKFPIWNLQALGTITQMRTAVGSYLFDFKEILQIDGKNKEGHLLNEQNQTSEEEPSDNYEEFENPEYWIKQINALKSLADVNKFESSYQMELSMFDGKDGELIKKTIDDKKESFAKKA